MAPSDRVDPGPFVLGEGDGGALLLHGLTGTPWDMRPIGEALATDGLRTSAPLLAGHGSLDALEKTTWQDWYASAERELDSLIASSRQRVAVGFSMGALLALRLAALRGDELAGVVAISVPLRLPVWKQLAVGMLSQLRQTPIVGRLVGRQPKTRGVDVGIRRHAERSPSLRSFPYPSLSEFIALQAEVVDCLAKIEIPLLLLHGRYDHAAPPGDSARVAQRVSSARVRRVVLPRSFHVLTLDLDADRVCGEILGFTRQVFATPATPFGALP